MALIDEIKKRLATTKAPDITGTQKQLQNVLQAKTGKARVGSGSPQASSMGEQAVQSELSQQGQQQNLQGQLAGAQLQQQSDAIKSEKDIQQEALASQKRMAESEMATQSTLAREGMAGQAARTRMQRTAQEEMKTAAINNAFQQSVANTASQVGLEQDNLFQEFRQSNEELEMRKDAAQIEQRAFDMAMADKEYVEEINAIGRMRNLDNNLTFKTEYTKLSQGEATSQLVEQLGWQKAFNADEREFQTVMASMNIDQAIAMANAAIKDSNSSAVFSGAIQGAQAYNQGRTTSNQPAAQPAPVSPATSYDQQTQQINSLQPPVGSW